MLVFTFQANEMANMTGHAKKVISVAADDQGKIFSSSLDKSVKLWQPQLSLETANQRHDDIVTFTVVSPDLSILSTGSRLVLI